MRRDELLGHTEILLEALESANIPRLIDESFQKLRNTSDSGFGDEERVKLLKALNWYSIIGNDFEPATVFLEQLFGLRELRDQSVWATLVSPEDSGEALRSIYTLQRRLSFATEYVPKIVELIQQDSTKNIDELKREYSDSEGDAEILRLILIHQQDRFSSPDRIVEALSSIDHLYEVYLELHALPLSSLAVISLDSGSDQSFDLLGIAKVIESIKDLIVELWDKIVFFNQRKNAEWLSQAVSTLSIIREIGELEEKGILQPEKAQILKDKASHAAEQFVNAGAYVPEIERRTHHNPRELLAPQPKLLVAPTKAKMTENEGDNASDSSTTEETKGLSEQELGELERLLKKAKAKGTLKSDDEDEA